MKNILITLKKKYDILEMFTKCQLAENLEYNLQYKKNIYSNLVTAIFF